MALTMPLDNDSWDLVLNAAGDWVLEAYDASIAQDVASAIQTFLGECWYDTTLGLPYFGSILGRYPPASLLQSKIRQAAMTIQDVLTCKVISLQLSNRVLTGTVVVTAAGSASPIVVTF